MLFIILLCSTSGHGTALLFLKMSVFLSVCWVSPRLYLLYTDFQIFINIIFATFLEHQYVIGFSRA